MNFYNKQIIIYFSFLLINCLSAQTSTTVSQIDTAWWYDNYSKGLEYLDSNDLKAAETEFRKILALDEDIAYAYYGLGLVYDKQEKGSQEAIDNFREAIKLKPDFIEAYYDLGLVYEYLTTDKFQYRDMSSDCFYAVTKKDPHFIDGWIALARLREKSTWPPSSEPTKTFTQSLQLNPNNKKLYQLFKSSVFWQSQEDISLPTFKYLMQKNPSIPEITFDYIHALYDLDRSESCLNILDSIEISFPDFSPCRINLLRAKTLFDMNNENEGLVYYWKAINAIHDSADANEFFSDLCYIINDNEVEEYQSTPITDLPDFYSRFWLSRDPNLATKINERIAEHYVRLKYARKNYRRYISDQSNKNILLYQTEHPFYGIVDIKSGDELLNPLVSELLPVNRDLDDMGIIYLRHGEPDNTAFYICDSCLLNVSWKYYPRKERPELIFHFTNYGGARNWTMESLPRYFENRYDLGALYAQLDPNVSPIQEVENNLSRYETINDQDIEYAEVGVNTETTDYFYENNLIEFPLEYLRFKDKDSKSKVDLFYGIEGKNIQLDTLTQRNHLDYATFIGIYDSKWNEILRTNNEKLVPINMKQNEWEKMSIIDLDGFSLSPGDYHYEIQLQDKVSANLGVYKGSLNIPDYWKNDLMLSDILLSGPVASGNEPARFKKGDVVYHPHMFSAYHKGETVGLYVEIYNLIYDYADRTNFEVTWILKEAGEDETAAFKSTLPYSGKTRDDKIYFNLDLSETDSGNYDLIIVVKDMVSDTEVSKKVELTVL